jgi:hypothetical protein
METLKGLKGLFGVQNLAVSIDCLWLPEHSISATQLRTRMNLFFVLTKFAVVKKVTIVLPFTDEYGSLKKGANSYRDTFDILEEEQYKHYRKKIILEACNYGLGTTEHAKISDTENYPGTTSYSLSGVINQKALAGLQSVSSMMIGRTGQPWTFPIPKIEWEVV